MVQEENNSNLKYFLVLAAIVAIVAIVSLFMMLGNKAVKISDGSAIIESETTAYDLETAADLTGNAINYENDGNKQNLTDCVEYLNKTTGKRWMKFKILSANGNYLPDLIYVQKGKAYCSSKNDGSILTYSKCEKGIAKLIETKCPIGCDNPIDATQCFWNAK